MIPVEFRDAKTHQPLPIDPQTGWYQCEQFRLQNLYVSVAPGIVPHTKEGEIFIALNDRDTEHNYDLRQVGSIGRFAGKLQLYDGASGDHPLEPALYINPRNMRKEDFKAIVRRLKQLAFMPDSPVVFGEEQKVRGQASKDSLDVENKNSDSRLVAEAQKFLTLCEIICNQWPLIERIPAQETCLTVQTVNVSQPGKLLPISALQRLCQRPDARRLQVLAVEETTRTVENSFLAFVLDEIQQDQELFRDRLKHQSKELEEEWQEKPYSLQELDSRSKYHQADLRAWNQPLRVVSAEWDAKKETVDKLIKNMRDTAASIKTRCSQLARYRNTPLLDGLVPMLPQNPSARLINSHEYAPVYAAFMEYNSNRPKLFVRLQSGLQKALTSMSLQPTHQLYELWVLVEVFEALVNRFGFRPIDDDTPLHLLERLDVVDNELVLAETHLAGRSFNFRFQCDDREDIDALLSYVKKVEVENDRFLEPDIHIEFSTRNKMGKIDKFSFVIDPKYRRYEDMRKSYLKERETAEVASMYEFDLIHTAKTKYKEKLKSHAAFVVHSDTNKDFTFWGGNTCYWNGDRWQHVNKFPNHTYGAICITPDTTRNIDRLLKCFLIYHMKIHDVCWNCQCVVEPKEDLRPGRQESVGNCYLCPQCTSFWVSTWCSGKNCRGSSTVSPFSNWRKNTILKVGIDTFHYDPKRNDHALQCAHCGHSGYTSDL